MNLPFTRAQFFQVFAAYNEAVWPLQFVLNVAAIAKVPILIRVPQRAGGLVSVGLALRWSWLAAGYHLAFFWAINPAAPFFAAISLAAAGAFLWLGVIRSSIQFRSGLDARKISGLFIVMFALAGYPAIGEFVGHRYPATPTFGLPCPTHNLYAWRPANGVEAPAQVGTGCARGLGINRVSRRVLAWRCAGPCAPGHGRNYMLLFNQPPASEKGSLRRLASRV